MKKITAVFTLVFMANLLSAQFLIIGKDSISLSDFKKDYKYGLENAGIAQTIKSAEDFYLMQQFSASQSVDTTAAFQRAVWQRESELRKEKFYPKSMVEPLLREYVDNNKNEVKALIFLVQKTDGDTNDYQKVYSDVKSGKVSMEDAVKQYTQSGGKPLYLKAGTIDNEIYSDLKKLQSGTYTKFYDKNGYYIFAKSLGIRPSLGHLIFGSISYPNDEKAEETKNKIYNDLKAGKKFQEVARTYGSNEHEKKNGGVVLGSPTLPDEVYELFKGQKEGFYTQPVLMENKYFVLNIYQITPYELNEGTYELFFQDMQSSVYRQLLQEKLSTYLKSQPGYKEFPLFQNLKKSYQAFDAYKNEGDALFQYKNFKTTVKDFKDIIGDKKDEAAKLTPQEWDEVYKEFADENLIKSYSLDFPNLPEVKQELEQTKKMLYSDYVFSKYLKEQVQKHPEWLAEYYNKNKSKYIWEKRAVGRVAIISDSKLVKDVEKEIKDTQKWEALKTKYYGKLNEKNQILVHFEQGEMPESSDVFTKYKVPFSKGIHTVKMEERDLVIAIDEILEPSQMTQEEAADLIKDAVTEQKLQELVAEQRAKTKIIAEPAFIKDLEKNFKK
ncbi:MAG: peptidylprolyl isomerase [Bergeyella sp.]